MHLTCPACNVTGSIEAFVKDEAAGELINLAGSLPPSLWRALLAYIGLFRTSRKLSFDKALKLAKEALALSANPAHLEQALEDTVEALRTKNGPPLKNHNYFRRVLESNPPQSPLCHRGEAEGRGVVPRSKAAIAIAALGEWAGDDWLRTGIAAGLSAAIAQNLTKTPAAEMITLNADVWHLALKTQLTEASIDAPRLMKAFEIMLPKLTEWPQPKQLLEQLPKRPVHAAIRHELTAEDHEKGMAKARQLKEELGIR